MAILFIASCVGLASCSKEVELVTVDVNDYNFYFLVDGKRCNLNETIYVNHDPTVQHSVEVLTEEGVAHLWYPDDESFFYWEALSPTNYTFNAQGLGSKKIRFVVGNIYDYGWSFNGAENYPCTKNTKNIYLNVVVNPLPDEILKMNMDLYIVNDFDHEVVRDNVSYYYYSTFLRLIGNGTVKHICDDLKVEAWGADDKDFVPIDSYPDRNCWAWNKWDKDYAWFDASVRGDVFHVYRGQYWPQEYYIKFRYAGKTYKLEKTSSSSVPVWTIE